MNVDYVLLVMCVVSSIINIYEGLTSSPPSQEDTNFNRDETDRHLSIFGNLYYLCIVWYLNKSLYILFAAFNFTYFTINSVLICTVELWLYALI